MERSASRSDHAKRPAGRRHRVPTSPGEGSVRLAWLDGGATREAEGDGALRRIGELLAGPAPAVWLDLASPSAAQVTAAGAALGLHPLIVEDVLEGNQRPKLELTNGFVHVVLFRLDFDGHVRSTEIDLVLGRGFLLTVHDRAWDPTEVHHLRGGLPAILGRGPDHLLWALCDDIVDASFPFADQLGDALDAIQDDIVRRSSPDVLERLFALKRELHEVRRSTSPMREVFNQLTNRDIPQIDPGELVYFRDVYDHAIRLTDELDNYRELAASTLDVYLTQVNNNLSVIMKRLTGVTVILAGIGAIAGIFGMSEASAALAGGEGGGFWLVTGGTLAAAVAAVLVLRRIDWI